MSHRFERVPAIFKDDETTCNALTSETSCNANSVCSWCTAGAVSDACHSIENAATLPPAVFHCSKVSEEDEEDDEEEAPPSVFEEWVHKMKKHHGGRQHGSKGGKHHDRRPRVESDHEEAEEHFQRKSHGHGKEHGGKHHGRRHHKKGCCIVAHVLGSVVLLAHFHFIRKLSHAQKKMEKITGKKEDKKVCGFKAAFQQPVVIAPQPVQQPVVVEYSPVLNTTQSSIEEEDKVDTGAMTYAPAPTGFQTINNQMV